MAFTNDYATRLAFCVSTAQRAGEIIRSLRHEGGLQHRYKEGIELVTSADEASHRFIHSEIESRYPQDVVVSEEAGIARNETLLKGSLWIVDPIDGTVNFFHGQDCVAIAIAYAENGIVKAGAVHAPFRGETFAAIKGEGASCNDRPIKVSETTRLRDALIGTGFPHARNDLTLLIRRLVSVLHSCQDVRRLGSPALDICFVADGRLDGFYEGSLGPWDVGAAALIAREAGANWGHLNGVPDSAPSDLYGKDVIVATPAIFDSLASVLREASLT
jgi:myo-inositol-1(or 4)-monophosphatase